LEGTRCRKVAPGGRESTMRGHAGKETGCPISAQPFFPRLITSLPGAMAVAPAIDKAPMRVASPWPAGYPIAAPAVTMPAQRAALTGAMAEMHLLHRLFRRDTGHIAWREGLSRGKAHRHSHGSPGQGKHQFSLHNDSPTSFETRTWRKDARKIRLPRARCDMPPFFARETISTALVGRDVLLSGSIYLRLLGRVYFSTFPRMFSLC
jgi:hypothetical protein